MQKIYVLGYFHHYNTGDEQYIYTFDYILSAFKINQRFSINYIDYDDIREMEFEDSDIIILGGGDILNDYFIDKVINKFLYKPNKIIAVSVGIPYLEILKNTNKLQIIDYIFLRTKQDLELLRQYFPSDRIHYLPDFSSFLIGCSENNLNNNSENNSNNDSENNSNNDFENIHMKYDENLKLIHKTLDHQESNGKKIISLMLSRHIYNKNNEIEYYNIIYSIVQFIKYLISLDYYIVLLPFNTNKDSTSENDILIHNDIMLHLEENYHDNIFNITYYLDPLDVIDLYKYFSFTIPMRFHAVLFSIYTKTPMLPIFTTRKIKNLLLDINWYSGYQLDCNEKDIPLHLDKTLLIKRFDTMVELNNHLVKKLINITKDHFVFFNIHKFIKLLLFDYTKIPFKLNKNILITRIDAIYKAVQNLVQKHGYDDIRLITDEKLQKTLTQFISYYLTDGRINSEYNYGIYSKIFKQNDFYNYKAEWEWVIKDVKNNISKKSIITNSSGLFNLKIINEKYIDQSDYSGVHRSGWQYVYDNIKFLHNDDSDLFLDMYLDSSFHWNYDINKQLGIVPYKQKWIGFVHHTFDTTFSDYNNAKLFTNEDFIESLKSCKGIFVLSKYLRNQFIKEFKKRKISVPVFNLVHPTETEVVKFKWKNFIKNNEKKLIHIGGWLRNIFSFYNLKIPVKQNENKCLFDCFNNDIILKKVALKGSYMNNYFPAADFKERLTTILKEKDNTNNQLIYNNICINNCSQNDNELINNWNKHFIEYIDEKFKSLEIIDKLDNMVYDNMLTENIVFINLVDASAINTLIECMVRNTPIVINDHPAVIELLGRNYPLYFTTIIDIYKNNLLSKRKIKRAYKYLCKLDKSKLYIKSFISDFEKYIEILDFI